MPNKHLLGRSSCCTARLLSILAVVCCRLLTSLYAVNGKLITKPENVFAITGDQVWLKCETDFQPLNPENAKQILNGTKDPVAWHRGEYDAVYRSGYILPKFKERFSVHEQEGLFILMISNVSTIDVDTYKCSDFNHFQNEEHANADLVLLDGSGLHCVHDIDICGRSEFQPVNVTVNCSVQFTGKLAPLLQWMRNGIEVVPVFNITTETVTTIGIMMPAEESLYQSSYSLYVKLTTFAKNRFQASFNLSLRLSYSGSTNTICHRAATVECNDKICDHDLFKLFNISYPVWSFTLGFEDVLGNGLPTSHVLVAGIVLGICAVLLICMLMILCVYWHCSLKHRLWNHPWWYTIAFGNYTRAMQKNDFQPVVIPRRGYQPVPPDIEECELDGRMLSETSTLNNTDNIFQDTEYLTENQETSTLNNIDNIFPDTEYHTENQDHLLYVHNISVEVAQELNEETKFVAYKGSDMNSFRPPVESNEQEMARPSEILQLGQKTDGSDTASNIDKNILQEKWRQLLLKERWRQLLSFYEQYGLVTTQLALLLTEIQKKMTYLLVPESKIHGLEEINRLHEKLGQLSAKQNTLKTKIELLLEDEDRQHELLQFLSEMERI